MISSALSRGLARGIHEFKEKRHHFRMFFEHHLGMPLDGDDRSPIGPFDTLNDAIRRKGIRHESFRDILDGQVMEAVRDDIGFTENIRKPRSFHYPDLMPC